MEHLRLRLALVLPEVTAQQEDLQQSERKWFLSAPSVDIRRLVHKVDLQLHARKHRQCYVLDKRTQSTGKYLGPNLSLSPTEI